jgi:methionyl-tRNA formyltransferase
MVLATTEDEGMSESRGHDDGMGRYQMHSLTPVVPGVYEDGDGSLWTRSDGAMRRVTSRDDLPRRSVLFVGKKHDRHTARALAHLERVFEVTACLGEWSDRLPEAARWWKGDYIISFLGRWVLPPEVIGHARVAAINFHPGPPEYPGIGCTNFALYDRVTGYGCTCHRMAEKVDTGGVIAVSRFAVYPTDDVASLTERTYDFMLAQFYTVTDSILRGRAFLNIPETWGVSHTRADLDALSHITPDMDSAEVARRIRATRYGEWKPTVEVGGVTFVSE